jgi:hypothetical protein
VLVLIGVLIFMNSVLEIEWNDLTEAIPALITILGMPFTHNIAYGIIGGVFMYVLLKFFTMQLFEFQESWPGAQLYKDWSASRWARGTGAKGSAGCAAVRQWSGSRGAPRQQHCGAATHEPAAAAGPYLASPSSPSGPCSSL